MTWVFSSFISFFQTIGFDGETIYFSKTRNEDRTHASRFSILYNIFTARQRFFYQRIQYRKNSWPPSVHEIRSIFTVQIRYGRLHIIYNGWLAELGNAKFPNETLGTAKCREEKKK